jgi:hypothetical protein
LDDNQDTVDIWLALLETDGYNPNGIYSARTIVADVQGFDPDTVSMDIAMPANADGMLRERYGNTEPASSPC